MSVVTKIKNFFSSNIFKSFFFQLASSFWTKFLSFLVIPILANFLGPEDFGKIDYFFIIISLVSIILCFEVFQTISPYLLGHEKTEKSERIFFSIKKIFPIWSLSIILISYLIIEYLKLFDNDLRIWWIPTLLLISLSNLTFDYFRWSGLPKFFTISFLSQSTTMLTLALYLIYSKNISVLSFIMITNISHISVIIIGIFYFIKIKRSSYLNTTSENTNYNIKETVISYFSNSGVLTLSIYFQLFAISIDRIITGTLSVNNEFLGEISYSYRLAWGAASIVLFASQITMQPWAIKISNKSNLKNYNLNLNRKNIVIINYLIFVLLGFIFSKIILGFNALDFLFTNYNLSRVIIPWHFVSIMFINIQICQPQLISDHKYLYIIFAYAISIILTFLLILFFSFDVTTILLLVSMFSSSLILLFSKTHKYIILIHLIISVILMSYYFFSGGINI